MQGDLGTDFTGRSFAERMSSRSSTTIVLALNAWFMEVGIGMGLGLWAGLQKGRLADRAVLLGTIVVSSVPIFVVAVTAQLYLGVQWKIFPVAGTQDGWPLGFLLPAACLAIFSLSAVSRLVRGSIIDSLGSDCVRTLWAKGIPAERVVGIHVLRNAGIPVLTFVAIDLGYLLGGAIVVEGIFNMPGIGQLLFDAIRKHERTTVVGVSSTLIIIFLLISALVDVVNSILDPRIRRD